MKLLTINEVAAILRVNKMTLYRLSKDGKIPAFKLGDSWRYEEESLMKWMRRTNDTTNWQSATVKAPAGPREDPIGPVHSGEGVPADGKSVNYWDRKVGETRSYINGRVDRWDGSRWRPHILPQRSNKTGKRRVGPLD